MTTSAAPMHLSSVVRFMSGLCAHAGSGVAAEAHIRSASESGLSNTSVDDSEAGTFTGRSASRSTRALFAVGEVGLASGSPFSATNTMTNFHHLESCIALIFHCCPFWLLFNHCRAETYIMDFPRVSHCIYILVCSLLVPPTGVF